MRPAHSKRSNRRSAKPAAIVDRPQPALLEPLAVRAPTAARLLSMGERTIWTWINDGRLKAHRVSGRITLVSMASIRAMLDAPSRPPRKRPSAAKEATTAVQP